MQVMVFLTVKEYAQIYRTTETSVWRWIKAGTLEARKVGHKWLIPHTATIGDPVASGLIENMLYDYSNDLIEEAVFLRTGGDPAYIVPKLEKITKEYVKQLESMINWKGVKE